MLHVNNKPKFYYENGYMIFFTTFKGTKVELLKVRINNMEIGAIRHYMQIAQVNLNELNNALSYVKKAA